MISLDDQKKHAKVSSRFPAKENSTLKSAIAVVKFILAFAQLNVRWEIRQMLRRLRFAASIACFATATALVAMMMRGIWKTDQLAHVWPAGPLASYHGSFDTQAESLGFDWTLPFDRELMTGGDWTLDSWDAIRDAPKGSLAFPPRPLFHWHLSRNRISFNFPHWIPIILFAAGGVFLAKGRAAFSLRTVLIAMTAIALLLGLSLGLQRAYG